MNKRWLVLVWILGSILPLEAQDHVHLISDIGLIEGGTVQGLTSPITLVVGIDLTCLGDSTADGDEYLILRYSDQAAGVYKRLALHEDKIVGAILMGDVQDARWLQQLITEERDVSAYGGHLLDGGVDLKALAQGKLP